METQLPLLSNESPKPTHYKLFKQNERKEGILKVTVLFDLKSGNFMGVVPNFQKNYAFCNFMGVSNFQQNHAFCNFMGVPNFQKKKHVFCNLMGEVPNFQKKNTLL
jgi:hypothetical protein